MAIPWPEFNDDFLHIRYTFSKQVKFIKGIIKQAKSVTFPNLHFYFFFHNFTHKKTMFTALFYSNLVNFKNKVDLLPFSYLYVDES